MTKFEALREYTCTFTGILPIIGTGLPPRAFPELVASLSLGAPNFLAVLVVITDKTSHASSAYRKQLPLQ